MSCDITIQGLDQEGLDIGEVALRFALSDRVDKTADPYLRHLETLANDVGAYANDDSDMRIEALRQVLIKRYGYGYLDEDETDTACANLATVIDSRNGLPVMLGVICLSVAHRLGWPLVGIDFPGRFLVRLDGDGERTILDPAGGLVDLDAGRLRDLLKAEKGLDVELTPNHYRVASPRDILLRIQNNVKARHLRGGHLQAALDTLRNYLQIDPDYAPLWRECGILNERLGFIEDAIEALEMYLSLSSNDEQRYRASILLQNLRSKSS